MAYCRKCGALIDDYAAVCPKCGTPQNGGPNNPPPAADNGGFLWGLLAAVFPLQD
ncbi:MAG: zinc-ribbon domain-containing protein [Dysosmobacter welbionis]